MQNKPKPVNLFEKQIKNAKTFEIKIIKSDSSDKTKPQGQANEKH